VRRGFSRSRSGQIRLRLEPIEVTVLADLVAQLGELVAPDPPAPDADPLAAMVGIDDSAEESDDPALQRLFPAAYPDDDEAAAEFRRFTERSLREGKAANAAVVVAGLAGLGEGAETLELTGEEARAWLGALNDLRLVLASRLGIDDDEGSWRGEVGTDPDLARLADVYDWLTWLQDGLVHAITS